MSFAHGKTLVNPLLGNLTSILIISEAVPIEPIQYWFYQSEQFPRFQYVYNQTRDCESRIEKAGMGRIRTHQMSRKVNIKIGIIGEFTDKDCTLISKRKGSENLHITVYIHSFTLTYLFC